MWRHGAVCNHCGRTFSWSRDRKESLQEISGHLQKAHGISAAREAVDYQIVAARQCDYCLEPYLDHCTKCSHDFCRFHAGDIDGLCGGCI